MRPPTGPEVQPVGDDLGLLEDVVPERRAALEADAERRQLLQVGRRRAA